MAKSKTVTKKSVAKKAKNITRSSSKKPRSKSETLRIRFVIDSDKKNEPLFQQILTSRIEISNRSRKKKTKQRSNSTKSKPKVLILDNKVKVSFIIIAIGFSLFGYAISALVQKSEKTLPIPKNNSITYEIPVKNSLKTGENSKTSLPTQLSIPSIGVDTKIITVGQNSDETLQTPDPLSNLAGWYEHSPAPGKIGPSIIVGHVDNFNGPSVFWNLGLLKTGDEITITNEIGVKIKFIVQKNESFDQSNFPTDKVYGNIDHSGLRLITCGGIFDSQTGKYTKNTVVFATLTN